MWVRQAIGDLDMETGSGCLHDLVQYLKRDFCVHHSELCAQSLSNGHYEYPFQRVQKAAASYVQDFERIIGQSNNSEPSELSWDRRLADATSQCVRYWLRTILNPVPDRAPETNAKTQWKCRVSEIVLLEQPADGSKVAVDDCSLSSLVSDALSHVYNYFGADPNLWQTKLTMPSTFCQSERCLRGIGKWGLTFTEEDWHIIGCQLEVATGYLAAVNGAQFLHQLLSIIASQRHHYLSSWTKTVQEWAFLLNHCQSSLQSQDAHLILLGLSPQVLLQNLQDLIQREDRKAACLSGLRGLANRFGFGSKHKVARKRSYQPHLGHLEHFWEQAMETVVFPTVLLAVVEEYSSQVSEPTS
jgi:hypothetical protein